MCSAAVEQANEISQIINTLVSIAMTPELESPRNEATSAALVAALRKTPREPLEALSFSLWIISGLCEVLSFLGEECDALGDELAARGEGSS